MSHVILGSKCVKCDECVEICPVEAISGSDDKQCFINPDLCIDCGACASGCQAEAIIPEDETAECVKYAELSKKHFA